MAQVLLVDDEPAVRWVVADLLGAAGHQCLEASDGQEALRLLRGREIDLVLADVRMPRMDGFRLFEELQPSIRNRVPFIFLSGHGVKEDIDVVLQSGAFGYLIKPCEAATLHALVGRALETRATWRAAAGTATSPEPVLPGPPVPVLSLPITTPSATARWAPRPAPPPRREKPPHVVTAPVPPKGPIP